MNTTENDSTSDHNPRDDDPRNEETLSPRDDDATATDAFESDSDDAATDERLRLDAQLRRTMADLANIRKRHAREIDEARKRAVEALSSELLPVLDNFEFALAAHDAQPDTASDVGQMNAMLDGLRMVRSLLEGTLERHGLAEIEAAGKTFDPMRHEAVGIDRDSDAAAGVITKVVQRGYTFGEKVLRASKVLVAGDGPDSEA